ncbi:MAG: substrate-binding domain-containing protein [Victivallales bacterium]|jgi:DNA-binding LacI/PurR family transcriptional regulator
METRQRISRHDMESHMENLSSAFYRDVILKKKISSSLLSVNELSAAYKVSVSTARKFYQRLQLTGVVGAEHRKGYFLKDPALFHSKWKSRKETIIGITGYLDYKHPLAPYNQISQILGALEKMSNEHGWRVQLYNTYPDRELTPDLLASIKRDKGELSCLFHVPIEKEIQESRITPSTSYASFVRDIEKLHKIGIPMLTTDHPSELATCISYDNLQIGTMATEYLLRLGHRRIAHVTFTGYDWAEERKKAYLETLAAHGVPVKESLISHVARGDEGSYCDCVMKLKKQHVTAVFCSNDEIAVALMTAGEKAGWKLHGAVAMIGVDDDVESRHMDLSTIQKNHDTIGGAAFKAMVNHLDHGEPLPQKILLKGSLLKRGSTEFIVTINKIKNPRSTEVRMAFEASSFAS